MSNVKIVGFSNKKAEQLQREIDRIMQMMDEKTDAITTIDRSGKTKRCIGSKRAPYLVVRDSSGVVARTTALALAELLGVDVEFERIGFVPGKKKPKKVKRDKKPRKIKKTRKSKKLRGAKKAPSE